MNIIAYMFVRDKLAYLWEQTTSLWFFALFLLVFYYSASWGHQIFSDASSRLILWVITALEGFFLYVFGVILVVDTHEKKWRMTGIILSVLCFFAYLWAWHKMLVGANPLGISERYAVLIIGIPSAMTMVCASIRTRCAVKAAAR